MSEAKTGHNVAGQASVTLGARLRKRRVELGWSLEQVESHLKMRHATLHAIEGERYSELPDKVYALGFIKSYAHFLKLDVADIMEQAERELASLVPKRNTIQLDLPGPQEGRSAGLWILLGVGLIVIAGGYAGWYHFYSRGEVGSSLMPAHTAVETTEPSSVGKKDTAVVVPVPEAQPSQSVAGQGGEQPAAVPAAPISTQNDFAAAKDVPDMPSAPEVLPPAPVGETTGDKDKQASAAAPVAQAPAPASTEQTPIMGGQQDIQHPVEGAVSILARETSWVQISDSAGKVLIARVLKPGETWQGTAGASYHVTCGNAGGVVFQTGNVVSAPLGQRGRVVRNLAVNATAIMQGHYGYGSPVTEGASSTSDGHH